jgi:hypothetical protein
MNWIENERRQNQAFAMRQFVFEETGLDEMAQIFRELIELSDRKIQLLEKFEADRNEMFGL